MGPSDQPGCTPNVPLGAFDGKEGNTNNEDDRYEDQKKCDNSRIDAHQSCMVEKAAYVAPMW